MSAPALRVLLVAEEAAGVRALRLAHQAGCEILAVVTDGIQRGAGAQTVGSVATALGCPVWPSARLLQPGTAETLSGGAVDLLLNVHSLRVLPAAVLEVPRIGSFNLHPGPLPRYAGLNCPSWAIYQGESGYGVTLHWMTARIDAGSIAYQESFEIAPGETGLTLSAKCVSKGIPLLSRLLATARENPTGIPRVAQVGERHYFGRRVPCDGWIDWTTGARQVDAFVRACDYGGFGAPWGRPRTLAGESEIAITGVGITGRATAEPPGTVGEAVGESVLVAASDTWVEVRRVAVGDGFTSPARLLVSGSVLRSPAAVSETTGA